MLLDKMQQPRDLPEVTCSLGLDPTPPLLRLPVSRGCLPGIALGPLWLAQPGKVNWLLTLQA